MCLHLALWKYLKSVSLLIRTIVTANLQSLFKPFKNHLQSVAGSSWATLCNTCESTYRVHLLCSKLTPQHSDFRAITCFLWSLCFNFLVLRVCYDSQRAFLGRSQLSWASWLCFWGDLPAVKLHCPSRSQRPEGAFCLLNAVHPCRASCRFSWLIGQWGLKHLHRVLPLPSESEGADLLRAVRTVSLQALWAEEHLLPICAASSPRQWGWLLPWDWCGICREFLEVEQKCVTQNRESDTSRWLGSCCLCT